MSLYISQTWFNKYVCTKYVLLNNGHQWAYTDGHALTNSQYLLTHLIHEFAENGLEFSRTNFPEEAQKVKHFWKIECPSEVCSFTE